MKIRSFFKRLILSNLITVLNAAGTRSNGPQRHELSFRTTDGAEICTWVYSA